MSAAQPPVFVDDSGRRRIVTRRVGRMVVIGFTGYLGLVALGFARDPRVGPVHLPTFGLPSLGLMIPPAPSVLGEQATRTTADAQPSEAERATAPTGRAERPATPAGGRTTLPRPTAPAPAASPTASRATTPTTGLPASNHTSATTSPSSSTTSSTTTTSPGPGQGQGQAQRSEAASTKGPDGSGPPGQVRKTTTTTAG